MKRIGKTLTQILEAISISYLIISIINACYSILCGNGMVSAHNQIRIFVWSAIAVVVLYSYRLFTRFSPLATIFIQYILAVLLITAEIFFETKILGVATGQGLLKALGNFSVPYFIGAFVYYMSLYYEVLRHDKLLKKVKAMQGEEGFSSKEKN